jgi:hypothetical protein
VPEDTPVAEPTGALPQLLDVLAEQLAAHDFQWRPMLSWMALSRPFGLSPSPAPQDRPELGHAPLFTGRYAPGFQRQGVTEALASLDPSRTDPNGALSATARVATGANPEKLPAETQLLAAGTEQRVVVDPLLAQQRAEPPADIRRIAESSMADELKWRHLFLATIEREPTAQELEQCRRIVQQTPHATTQPLLDLWWALRCSAEAQP